MMQAVFHAEASGPEGLRFGVMNKRKPGRGEVEVQLRTAGLNHRDLFLMRARSAAEEPLILGSDGAGTITELGEGVTGLELGEEVMLHPVLGWEYKEDVPPVPNILGGPEPGTFAERITVPQANVFPKPAYLSWEEAGVLPLSALTAYRALFTQGRLQRGEHVLITGIGGGVATYALLMAQAAGARVSVTSRSRDKLALAAKLGASGLLDSGSNWLEELNGSADLVVDSVGPALFASCLQAVKPGGRIISFGASSGDTITLPLRALFFPQVKLIGTSMGSREEFKQMLAFMEHYRIHPVVDRYYPLEEAAQAVSRMSEGVQFGNIGLHMPFP